MIAIIAALAHNNVIGAHNELPWYLPADLKHFREITTGHTVVMGRKTLESIITRIGGPLPNRTNVVLTRDEQHHYEDVDVIYDIDDLMEYEAIYIIGGAEVYRQTIDMANRLYITEIHAEIDGDTYFPAIDNDVWHVVSREKHHADEKNDYDYDFVLYERKS